MGSATSQLYHAHLIKPSFHLLGMPSDMIIEIMTWLEIREIHRLRQTCRYMNAIARERSLLIAILRKQDKAAPLQLVKPLDSYTILELEKLAFKLWRVSKSWAANVSQPVSVQEISYELEGTNECRELVVLPGGRWILCLMTDGRIDSWELDENPRRREILVGKQWHISDRRGSFMAYSMGQEELYSFDLAVVASYGRDASGHPHGHCDVSFWHVAFDAEQDRLVATTTTSFSFIGLLVLPRPLLSTDTLCCATTIGYGGLPTTASFKWRDTKPEALRVSNIQHPSMIAVMELLPYDRLACFYQKEIRIYQQPRVRVVSDLSSTWPPSCFAPIWTYMGPTPGYYFGHLTATLSRPIVSGQDLKASMILATQSIVVKITVPPDADSPLDTEVISIDIDKKGGLREPHFGHRRALCWRLGGYGRDAETTLSLIDMSTPKDGDGFHETEVTLQHSPGVVFDEQSGRIAYKLMNERRKMIGFAVASFG